MIRRLIVLFVWGLFLAVGAPVVFAQETAKAAPAGPASRIKFDATEVNLGDVVHGEDAVATFTYHNTGDAPLRILSAKPG